MSLRRIDQPRQKRIWHFERKKKDDLEIWLDTWCPDLPQTSKDQLENIIRGHATR